MGKAVQARSANLPLLRTPPTRIGRTQPFLYPRLSLVVPEREYQDSVVWIKLNLLGSPPCTDYTMGHNLGPPHAGTTTSAACT